MKIFWRFSFCEVGCIECLLYLERGYHTHTRVQTHSSHESTTGIYLIAKQNKRAKYSQREPGDPKTRTKPAA